MNRTDYTEALRNTVRGESRESLDYLLRTTIEGTEAHAEVKAEIEWRDELAEAERAAFIAGDEALFWTYRNDSDGELWRLRRAGQERGLVTIYRPPVSLTRVYFEGEHRDFPDAARALAFVRELYSEAPALPGRSDEDLNR